MLSGPLVGLPPGLAATVSHMPRVHLIEDDLGIRSALIRALTELGHVVTSSPDAMSGLQDTLAGDPDIVILDLGLPDLDGVELLRMLRAVTAVPVIVATARDEDSSVVRALDAGADDYVIKPFTSATIDARIRAVLRRSASPETNVALQVGSIAVDPRSRVATIEGRLLELSPREFDLLAYLAARPGEVVSKRELLAEVWRLPYGGADKTVDVHLSWLRKKLGESATDPRHLITVRGVGVKLVEGQE